MARAAAPGLAIVLVLVLALAAWPGSARAHLGSTKYLSVERAGDTFHVAVEIERVDVAMHLGLGEQAEAHAVLAQADAIRGWLEAGITVRAGDAPCTPSAGSPGEVERDQRPFVRVELDYACPPGAGAPTLRDGTVFPDDPQHESIFRLAFAGQEGASILRRGRQEASLAAAPGAAAIAGAFLWEGVLHFATGYDHILFLLGLVLAAGFVAREKGVRAALRDVGILVTAFTVGHSVTLITAALGYVVLPSRLVESVIAASIVCVAVLNVVRPEARGPMPWLGLGFGLVHGFGFSSVLAELGLPRSGTVVSLLSFNVGIELAQLAFVLLAMGPIAWAARSDRYRPVVVRGGSVAIGLLAAFWFVERAFGL